MNKLQLTCEAIGIILIVLSLFDIAHDKWGHNFNWDIMQFWAGVLLIMLGIWL